MEVVTLNSSFQPESIFEKYESFVWNERYSGMGDFELVSSDIVGTLSVLEEDTYLSLIHI